MVMLEIYREEEEIKKISSAGEYLQICKKYSKNIICLILEPLKCILGQNESDRKGEEFLEQLYIDIVQNIEMIQTYMEMLNSQ